MKKYCNLIAYRHKDSNIFNIVNEEKRITPILMPVFKSI